MKLLAHYTQFGGTHPETATLTNALAALGVGAPHTGQPFSEALIFGIAGGLGAGYILFEFKHGQRHVVMAFQNQWNYPVRFMDTLLGRIGATGVYKETSGRKAAAAHLCETLDAGIPAVTWIDRPHQPYFALPDWLKGYGLHMANIVGMDDETAWIDDLGAQPFSMAAAALAESRAQVPSNKNRVLAISPPIAPIDLKAAIHAGIVDCIGYLDDPSESFALPTFRKLGKMLNDDKNAKGWRKAFAGGTALYGALKTMYESIRLPGNGGDGLRGLYADFLDEAAAITGNTALTDAAGAYRALASDWIAFGEALLPDSIAGFSRAKLLMNENAARMLRDGDACVAPNRVNAAELEALQMEYDMAFPMAEKARADLLTALSAQMGALFDTEICALDTLKRAAATLG